MFNTAKEKTDRKNMKITIETPLSGQEDEIIIRMTSISDEVLSLIRQLKDGSLGHTVPVYDDNDNIHMLSIDDIYYFDSVDNRVFAYTKDKSFEVKKKLYEIEDDYSHSSFVRISKNTIANLRLIANLSPEFNGRFVARMKNNEELIISRGYVPVLKQKLGIGR